MSDASPKKLLEQAKEVKKQKKANGLKKRADAIIESLTAYRLIAGSELRGATSVYKVLPNNVVTPVNSDQLEVIVHEHLPNEHRKERKEIVDFIKLRLALEPRLDLNTVQPVAFADEVNTLTWMRLQLTRSELPKLTLDELPEFSHLLGFCDDPRALVLWIGSLLDPKSARFQYLHLHGLGGNGKSRLFDGITEVLGQDRVVRARSSNLSQSHWGEQLEGARLLLFADDNNPGFVTRGEFKELTGETSMTVNPKNQKPRLIRLTNKTAIISNNAIEISSNAADRRRLLSVSVSQDPEVGEDVRHTWWYEGMFSSAPKILGYCFHEYEKAVEADPTVRSSIPQSRSAIEAAVSRKYEDIINTIKSFYLVTGDESDKMDRTDVLDTIVNAYKERKSNRVFIQQVREALTRLGVSDGFRTGGYAVYRGIRNRIGNSDLRLIELKEGKS